MISKSNGDKMLLVTGIEYKTVPKDVWEIQEMGCSPDFIKYPEVQKKMKKVETEIVSGRRYTNADRKEICLGISKDVQEILGIPFDDFENMQETNDRLNFNCGRVEYENSKLQIENQGYDSVIEEIKAWNFWQRLKFLFKGKK